MESKIIVTNLSQEQLDNLSHNGLHSLITKRVSFIAYLQKDLEKIVHAFEKKIKEIIPGIPPEEGKAHGD